MAAARQAAKAGARWVASTATPGGAPGTPAADASSSSSSSRSAPFLRWLANEAGGSPQPSRHDFVARETQAASAAQPHTSTPPSAVTLAAEGFNPNTGYVSANASKFPTTDAEGAVYIRRVYTDGIETGRKRRAMYAKTRALRIRFSSEFSMMRRRNVAGVETYTEAVALFAQLGMPARAQVLFDLALEDHVYPTARMYGRLMKAYSACGDVAGMAYVLGKAHHHTANPDIAGKFVRSCIKGLHRSGNRLAMFEVAVMCWGVHRGHPAVYSALISACSTYEHAGTLITEMTDRGHAITLPDWGAFLDSAALCGDIMSTLSILQAMKELNVRLTQMVLTQALSALLAVGDPERFQGVFDAISTSLAECDSVLIATYLRHCETHRDAPLLEDVLSVARTTGGQRSVELLVGIYGSRCDSAGALSEFNSRGRVLGNMKLWIDLLTRLRSTLHYALHTSVGLRPSAGLLGIAYDVDSEKRGINDTIAHHMLDAAQANRGYSCLRVWRMMEPLVNDKDGKRYRVAMSHLRTLADLMCWRIMQLWQGGECSKEARARCRQILGAMEAMHAAVSVNSPWRASALVTPLVGAYGELGLVERAVRLYRMQLLAGYPKHLLELEGLFTEVFAVRDDTAALAHLKRIRLQDDCLMQDFQNLIVQGG